jgi:hypothetical protein
VRFADVARTLDAFNDRVCFGTLLSREQYLADIEQLGISTRASNRTAR